MVTSQLFPLTRLMPSPKRGYVARFFLALAFLSLVFQAIAPFLSAAQCPFVGFDQHRGSSDAMLQSAMPADCPMAQQAVQKNDFRLAQNHPSKNDRQKACPLCATLALLSQAMTASPVFFSSPVGRFSPPVVLIRFARPQQSSPAAFLARGPPLSI